MDSPPTTAEGRLVAVGCESDNIVEEVARTTKGVAGLSTRHSQGNLRSAIQGSFAKSLECVTFSDVYYIDNVIVEKLPLKSDLAKRSRDLTNLPEFRCVSRMMC
jgi:hypothetical protein